jgi:hypothetical protein
MSTRQAQKRTPGAPGLKIVAEAAVKGELVNSTQKDRMT